jgi:hypothetical protein
LRRLALAVVALVVCTSCQTSAEGSRDTPLPTFTPDPTPSPSGHDPDPTRSPSGYDTVGPALVVGIFDTTTRPDPDCQRQGDGEPSIDVEESQSLEAGLLGAIRDRELAETGWLEVVPLSQREYRYFTLIDDDKVVATINMGLFASADDSIHAWVAVRTTWCIEAMLGASTTPDPAAPTVTESEFCSELEGLRRDTFVDLFLLKILPLRALDDDAHREALELVSREAAGWLAPAFRSLGDLAPAELSEDFALVIDGFDSDGGDGEAPGGTDVEQAFRRVDEYGDTYCGWVFVEIGVRLHSGLGPLLAELIRDEALVVGGDATISTPDRDEDASLLTFRLAASSEALVRDALMTAGYPTQ